MDGQEDYVPPEAHQVAAHHPGRGILSGALAFSIAGFLSEGSDPSCS